MKSNILGYMLWLHCSVIGRVDAFSSLTLKQLHRDTVTRAAPTRDSIDVEDDPSLCRRTALSQLATGVLLSGVLPTTAAAEESFFAPKFIQEYPDFTQSSEGWSYKDVKTGNGDSPKSGDRVVFEWSGYTVGYFARPFEARGGPKGGAFDKEQDYARVVLGSGEIVKGLDCAFQSMKPGGIRQVLVPYGELGYPADDSSHDRVGPKPATFSGMRALNFVLDNPRVDRTMLFNVKLVRVDKPDGKGGFVRGDKMT